MIEYNTDAAPSSSRSPSPRPRACSIGESSSRIATTTAAAAPHTPRRRGHSTATDASSKSPRRTSASTMYEQRQNQLLQATHYASATQISSLAEVLDDDAAKAEATAATLDSIDLVITVQRGEGLAAKDRNWKGEVITSDPYVVCKLLSSAGAAKEKKRHEVVLGKTKIVKQSLSPAWNETFEISLGKDDFLPAADATGDNNKKERPAPQLQLIIMDHDLVESDDCMGVVTLPLDTDKPLNGTSEWYKVPSSSAPNASGRIQLSLQTKLYYSDGRVVAAPCPSSTATQTGLDSSTKTQQKRESSLEDVEFLDIDLTVVQGDGLAAKDRNSIGKRTTSDPYVDIVLLPTGPGGRELSLGLTHTIPKTLTPAWNDHFTTTVPLATMSNSDAQLRLTILDCDVNTADDCMGVVHIHVPVDDNNGGQKIANQNYTKWYGVPPTSAPNASGRIQCVLKTDRRLQHSLETQRAEASSSMSGTLQQSQQQLTESTTTATKNSSIDKEAVDSMIIAVTILEGAGLAAKDRNIVGQRTTSDPYIMANLLTTPPGSDKPVVVALGQTKTVLESLNPVWNERFETKILGKDLLHLNEAELQLKVYDYDITTKDDCMGIVTIPVQLETTSETTRWYGIPLHSARNASGRLQVKIETQVSYHAENLQRRRGKSVESGLPEKTRAKRGRLRKSKSLRMSATSASKIKSDLDMSMNRSGSNSRPSMFAKPSKARSKDTSAYCTPRRTTSKTLKPKGKLLELKAFSLDDGAKIDALSKKNGKTLSKKSIEKTASASSTKASRAEKLRSRDSPARARDSPSSVAASSIYCTPRRDEPRNKVKTPNAMHFSLSAEDDSGHNKRKGKETYPPTTGAENKTDIKTRPTNRENDVSVADPVTATAAEPTAGPSPDTADQQHKEVVSSYYCRRVSSTVWKCCCGYESAKSRKFCGMCGIKQHWSCTECSYDQNLCLYKYCCMCGIPKDGGARKKDASAPNTVLAC